MLGAANQIMDGLCSGDSFWYFQPWLIGQGRHWWRHAAQHPDNLADLPAVQALAGRRPQDWPDPEWPDWDDLAHVAARAYDHVTGHITGNTDGIDDALHERGHRRPTPTVAAVSRRCSGNVPAVCARFLASGPGRDRRRPRWFTKEAVMKTCARFIAARMFGRTQMGGVYLYWVLAK